MDPFSYICVLTSIVAGLAVTRLVSGFGQLLQTRARTLSYWVHAPWVVNVLLSMIITLWVQYRWRNAPHWTLFLFVWADICDRPRRYVAQRTHLLLVSWSALLRVDVAADHFLLNRSDNQTNALSRVLR